MAGMSVRNAYFGVLLGSACMLGILLMLHKKEIGLVNRQSVINIQPYGQHIETLLDTEMVDMTEHVAIGCAVTSRKRTHRKKLKILHFDVKRFLFFSQLWPSICNTASAGYVYHIYISYDHIDPFYRYANNREEFRQVFEERKCKIHRFNVTLDFVACTHNKHPAWAQNDAMIAAYLDNMEYMYRVNDDTVLATADWTNKYIKALKQLKPPNVGVVGPRQSEGNMHILAYDFVHRTHVDIFGYYYPREFIDWFADRWVTMVYDKVGKKIKLNSVAVRHTMKGGTRYTVHKMGWKLPRLVRSGAHLIERYVAYLNTTNKKSDKTSREKQVIAISMTGNIHDILGAVRNAQLVPLFFPGWTLRVYAEQPENAVRGVVGRSVISRLIRLGAEVVYIPANLARTPWTLWSFLIMDDLTVDRFIVRQSRSRLSELDDRLVSLWVKSGTPFHCIRDHPKHASQPVIEYLWGGVSPKLRGLFNTSIADLIMANQNKSPSQFMTQVVWPNIKHLSMCHDSVSCNKWERTVPMPYRTWDTADYLGQSRGPSEELMYIRGARDEFHPKHIVPECITK